MHPARPAAAFLPARFDKYIWGVSTPTTSLEQAKGK